jgi:hypothetical protein
MLSANLIQNGILSLRSSGSFPLDGPLFENVAAALSQALMQWIPTVQLQGVCVGTAGSGPITQSRVFLPGNASVLLYGLQGNGVSGPLAASLSHVLGTAVPQVVSTYGSYLGFATGVGTGVDHSRVVLADSSSLSWILQVQLSSRMVSGPVARNLAQGLSQGFQALFLTLTGTGVVSGVSGPLPGSGVSRSLLG